MWFWPRWLRHTQNCERRCGWWRQRTEERDDGEGDDLHIEPDGVMASVIPVYFELCRHQRRLVVRLWMAPTQKLLFMAEIDLRQPSDAWAHAQNFSLFRRIGIHIASRFWTWPDQAHL